MKHCSHIQPSPNVLAQEEHVNSYFYKILIKNRKKKKMNRRTCRDGPQKGVSDT